MSRLSIFSATRRSRIFPARTSSLAGLIALLCLTAPALRAQEDTAGAISREVKSLFERCGKAVVKIHAVDEHSELSGTGFFVDPTGTIYTSYSVGGEADNFSVQFEGKQYHATQLMADLRSGIALLKVDAATPFLPIGKSAELGLATPVVAIGYPLDLPESPSFGMIAGFDRKYLGRYFSTTHLRVNLPTQRGEAGAPLLNFQGQVVGILVSSVDSGSACYALPIDAAEKIRRDYVRFGDARHGWIGIDVQEAENPVEGSSAEMTQIRRGLTRGGIGAANRRHPFTGGQETGASAGGRDRRLIFHHCRRSRADHGHAREGKADLSAGPVRLVPAPASSKSEAMALGPSKKSAVPLRLDAPPK